MRPSTPIYFFQRADGAYQTPDRRVHVEAFGNVAALPSDEQARLNLSGVFSEEIDHAGFSVATLPLAPSATSVSDCRPNSGRETGQGIIRRCGFG